MSDVSRTVAAGGELLTNSQADFWRTYAMGQIWTLQRRLSIGGAKSRN